MKTPRFDPIIVRVPATDSLRCRGCGEQIEVSRRAVERPDYLLLLMEALESMHHERGCAMILEARASVAERMHGAA